MRKPKLCFHGQQVGNLKTVQRILGETNQYDISSDFDGQADYIVTSHAKPSKSENVKEIHVGHGTGPIGVSLSGPPDCYAWCVPGENHLRQYAELGCPEDSLMNIGMPYSLDFLGVDSDGRKEFLTNHRQDPKRKTVLYAPTWDHGDPRGFFALWCGFKSGEEGKVDRFCRYITQDLDCNLIVRFHEDHRYSKNWLHDVYNNILSRYNVYAFYYPDHPDDAPYIKYSDVLIGDMSSINTCFYIADKPMVLIGTDIYKRKREKCGGVTMEDRNSSGYVTDDFDEMLSMVKDSLGHPERYKAERKAFVNKYIDYVGETSRQAVIGEFARVCK